MNTVSEAARLLRVAHPTITKHARSLGLVRKGRDWLFDDADIEALRESIRRAKPGRPTACPPTT